MPQVICGNNSRSGAWRIVLETRCWARLLSLALLGTTAWGAVGCSPVQSRMSNTDGVRLYQQAYFPQAQQKFQQALQANPNNPDAYYNLAATYHQLAKSSGKKTDFDQAETYYQQCLSRAPNHRDCNRALAVLLMDDGRSEEAFRLMEDWVARVPTGAEARVELARLFDEHGDPQAAKQNLLQALHLNPNDSRALAALGKVRDQMGEHTQALADYQRSLSLNRNQPELASRLRQLQDSLGPASRYARSDTPPFARAAPPAGYGDNNWLQPPVSARRTSSGTSLGTSVR